MSIRALFGALERVAPRPGAALAERLWLTMPRYRGGRRSRTLPLAETFSVTVDGGRVTGRAWGMGPRVYLVHGWGGASEQLEPFVEPLLTAGYRVITFDALSHGDSEPGRLGQRRTTIPEMAAALTAVVAEHGQAHAVISHSLGCAATFFAVRRGLPAGRLVFLAPMTQPDPYTILFAARLGFGERIRAGMRDRVAARVGLPWSEFDIPSQVAGLAAPPPLLLVHDPRDRETRYADSLAVQRVWPDARLITVTGRGHWRILRDRETIDHTLAFLAPRAGQGRQVS
ncbi:MAG TPA: alpha/beta fold hydrolase [Actinophytocola sp.]|uniref:alpha/beta fold hydrolase n=1 Tax=Actinophytocola sp. TaxID=1872138 RepID=UPI002DDD8B97|nr:alpha/beta fold hydrolase [Actinophytocola sp.]HEV2781123.1 alpha/beta fold hydrolase [Actinophytocola sp.]